ncbi:unnamed protein product [Pneumocystis jirovecii]|uniref:HMG box domain-containing protein n=1 Tax=Pneumocystis jirovecii TaxID=42068 RepID=L0PDF6_PNEJI|nr:unnamed protein product [Pneumocystis jirovecii]
MFSSKDTQSEVSYINAWHKKQTAVAYLLNFIFNTKQLKLASAFRLLSEACSAAARELQKVKHVAVEQSATENSIFSSSEIQMIQESTPELQADVTEVKKRKARDPNQPKRPLSAYLSFQLKTRQAVKDSLGESATQKEILSEIAERWSKLNDDERKPFEEEARKAREQYDKEMTAYRSSESKNNSNALLTKENPVETHIKTPPLQKDLEESKESLKTVSIVEVNDTNTSKNNINEVVKEKKRKHKKKGDGSHLSSDGNASLKEEKKERKKHKKKEGHVEKG